MTHPTSKRELARERDVYEQLCELALDFWAGGYAQRQHLQEEMHSRLGQVRDPANPSDDKDFETGDGRIIREGRMELFTVPFLRAIIESQAVLYAADDLERTYGDETTARTIAHYHEVAGLTSKLHLIDAFVVLLRSPLMLVRWNDDLKRIVYDVMPPHWVWTWTHPQWPLENKMAYAVCYAEESPPDPVHPEVDETVWCAYQRPPFKGDPEDAPTIGYDRGRFVRYTKQDGPWPIPDTGDEKIIADGTNPLVDIGGMNGGKAIWSPLVWHWAEPPTESLFLDPAEDLVRANLELDVGLTMLLYVANMQSAGQPYITGSGSLPSALGPSRLVQIDDPGGSFGFASPGADLHGHMEVVQRLLQIQSMLRHLAPDTYSLQRPSISTGPAKLLEQYALTESRWRRVLMADMWERDRFDLERLYHNALGVTQERPAIPEDTRQVVRWGEMRVPHNRMEQVTRLAQEISLGVSNQLDAVMEVWGIDRDAARAKLDENALYSPDTKPDSAAAPGVAESNSDFESR